MVIWGGMGVVLVGRGRCLLGEEDEGVFMRRGELGWGGRMVKRRKVVEEVRDYYVRKEKDNVEWVFRVGGFGLRGEGEKKGVGFMSVKGWCEGVGEEKWVRGMIEGGMIGLRSMNKGVVLGLKLGGVGEVGRG